jgi:hypothetical protein
MQSGIIWIFAVWSCAAVFSGLGIYAGKREKPMWFWSGSTVTPEKVKDIPAYNRANRKMWLMYSIPFWITGISYFWYPKPSVIIMLLACTVGLGWLIYYYHRIEKKFMINE